MMRQQTHEPYSVSPQEGSRAYLDSPYCCVYIIQVCTTGWFSGSDCELSRWVNLDSNKSVKSVFSTWVHLGGQFMSHVLTTEVYSVVGVFTISGFYFLLFRGTFKFLLFSLSISAFEHFIYFTFISFCFLPVNLFSSRNRFECYVAWYITVVCVCVPYFLWLRQ